MSIIKKKIVNSLTSANTFATRKFRDFSQQATNSARVGTLGKLKRHRPMTAGLRGTVTIDKSVELHRGGPLKILTQAQNKTGGRNNHGRITVRHRGGAEKRVARIIDFKRQYDNMYAEVKRIEYDPNNTFFIALVQYENGMMAYIPHSIGLKVGAKIISGTSVDCVVGNCMELENIAQGTIVHCIESRPGSGAIFCRSAGCGAMIIGRDGPYIIVQMPSGERRRFLSTCRAVIGRLSNEQNMNTKVGKAGRNRRAGIRPTVRGVAMNPVDHPLGGGNGKTSGGRHPVSPWGKGAKGTKTRNKKKSNYLIVEKRSK